MKLKMKTPLSLPLSVYTNTCRIMKNALRKDIKTRTIEINSISDDKYVVTFVVCCELKK